MVESRAPARGTFKMIESTFSFLGYVLPILTIILKESTTLTSPIGADPACGLNCVAVVALDI